MFELIYHRDQTLYSEEKIIILIKMLSNYFYV